MSTRVKIAIFISGRGSNMMSLLEACKSPDFPASPVLVISNRSDAPGLQAARQAGIATATLVRSEFPSPAAYDRALEDTLTKHKVELVCLAGFMQILSKQFVEKWHNRLINIHPSLLPSFKGLNVHERALEAGVKFTGCTVHFVRYEMDTGPIIAQAVVPVAEEDTADSLAARVLEQEHKIYPEALKLVASGVLNGDLKENPM
jgi:phosphoribosylglycinamide formyltransferase 1